MQQLTYETLQQLIAEAQAETKTSRGVAFEWQLVWECLKRTKQLTPKRLTHPNLKDWGEPISTWARQAVDQAVMAEANISQAYHSDELKISGNPEPKTDICFGDDRVSVKMPGTIQLASGEGASTANVFFLVLAHAGLTDELKKQITSDVIEKIKEMPTKMLSQSNIEKALTRKPELAKSMLSTDQKAILDKSNYQLWRQTVRQQLLGSIQKLAKDYPEFHKAIIEEALTGKLQFTQEGTDPRAVATHVITPLYYSAIDSEYVDKIAAKTKIDIRAKSRDGITSVTMRFDVKV